MTPLDKVGVVVIGRNEGDRLRRCLESIRELLPRTVYVDSGSTDGSVATAGAMGATVESLDMSIPFTAARARNRGFERLSSVVPDLVYAQFVDGDCELDRGWIGAAIRTLDHRERVGVVCGRRRERHPEASIYNRLCDLEWDTPVGDARACGGDALFRAVAFREVGGFDPTMIAGEEPELCVRLRARGWTITRIDAEMTIHDAAMMRLGQWWKRSVRAGHAYAEGAWKHGRGPMRHNVKPVLSAVAWGLALPVAGLAFAWPTQGISLGAAMALYGVLWARVRASRRRRGDPPALASLYAEFCVLGKFAHLVGAWKFLVSRISGRRTRLIEYKGATPGAVPAREVRT